MSSAFNQPHSAHTPAQILLRFGTFLLACVLLALHWGRSLSQEIADLCQFVGLCGLAFYFALEVVADQRARKEWQAQHDTSTDINLADQRLSNRLLAEQKLAKIIERERDHNS